MAQDATPHMQHLPDAAQAIAKDCCIIVFARLPVPGQVKTRLSIGVGREAACDFYHACAEHILHQAARCPGCRVRLQHSSGDSTVAVQGWIDSLALPQALEVLSQVPDFDLGAKMHAALSAALNEGYSKALVIGTDIPDITTKLLDAALKALDNHQVVLGPAVDGGYWLLGITQPQPTLFQDMTWSSPHVLADTLRRVERAGLLMAPMHTLPCLQDIDTIEDVEAWWRSHTNLLTEPSEISNRVADVNEASASTPQVDRRCGSHTPTDTHALPLVVAQVLHGGLPGVTPPSHIHVLDTSPAACVGMAAHTVAERSMGTDCGMNTRNGAVTNLVTTMPCVLACERLMAEMQKLGRASLSGQGR